MAKTASVTYTNPVLPGFYPDPSVVRVGDDYYLTTSTFEYFPGLPIFHSRDLMHWSQIGHALHRPEQLDMTGRKSSEGIFAPTIRYHEGTFYIITTDAMGIGNFYISAQDPAGPWSDPIRIPYGNIDPSLMFDEDGKVYVTAQSGADADSHIIQYEIDIETGQALSEPVVIARGDGGVWTEGPHLYNIRGSYYLVCACGGTGRDHRALVYRSEQPYGPFEMMPHPMLTHNGLPDHPIQNTGHAELLEGPDGTWWIMFLGVRPVDGQYSVLGRETFLAPVRWNEEGWPVVDNNEGTVSLTMTAGGTADAGANGMLAVGHGPIMQDAEHSRFGTDTGGAGLTGVGRDGRKAHSWRDDFDRPQMELRWTSVRAWDRSRIALTEREGSLTLRGNAFTLRDDGPVVFAGVRQQHLSMTAMTELSFVPIQAGDEAGLAVRLNERGHLTLGVCRLSDGRRILRAVSVDQGDETVLAEIPMQEEQLFLCMESDGRSYSMLYSLDRSGWTCVASAPAAVVSSDRNGGFTGAMIGLYATGNGSESKAYACYEFFEYTGYTS